MLWGGISDLVGLGGLGSGVEFVAVQGYGTVVPWGFPLTNICHGNSNGLRDGDERRNK